MSASNRWWRDYGDECRDWWNDFLCMPETAPGHAYAIVIAQFAPDTAPDAPLCDVMPVGWMREWCPVLFCTQRANHLGPHE